MIRTAFAIALAALTTASVSGTSQAAPIAPLPGVTTANTNHVTQAYCWRGRYGHLHCR